MPFRMDSPVLSSTASGHQTQQRGWLTLHPQGGHSFQTGEARFQDGFQTELEIIDQSQPFEFGIHCAHDQGLTFPLHDLSDTGLTCS